MNSLLVSLDPRQAALLFRAACGEAKKRWDTGYYSQALTLVSVANKLEEFLEAYPTALGDVELGGDEQS